MTETSLEQLVQERQFIGILETHGEVFFRLSSVLLGGSGTEWNKKHYFPLLNEAEALEAVLDDFGARFNRTYAFFTELIASLRGFAQAGYSISHILGRLGSYGAPDWMDPGDYAGLCRSLAKTRGFIQDTVGSLLLAVRQEAQALSIQTPPEEFPESSLRPVVARLRLPRNVGQAVLVDEEQKIAEVASKFLQACDMFAEIGVRPLTAPGVRREFLGRVCTEERARVYEATIHNLQSTYDTHIQNTVLEARDERLGRLRGHVSSTLHLLTAVTYLTHFFERHEDEIRSEEVKHRIGTLVDRDQVQEVILNELLVWAARLLRSGREVAEDLLPEYTNVQELEVEVSDGLVMHARPAALIVGIVNHYGTPVEMEIAGRRCNAASILELLVSVGSHPDERRFVFRGDENPLRDIRVLFECGLAEEGMDSLPGELAYLRSDPIA